MKTALYSRLLALLCTLTFLLTACQEENEVAPQQEPSKSILETLAGFDQELSYNIYSEGENINSRWGYSQGEKKGFAERTKKVPTFFTLAAALEETNLLKTVIQNKLTVFAPTDDAFAALGLTPENIGSVPNLASILLYHVVPGLVFSGDLTEGPVATVNGATVEISLDGGVFVNDVEVIAADVRALNSVLHVIDMVLLPPN